MPNPEGWKNVQLPPETLEKLADIQRIMAERDHIKLSTGLVARHLIDLAYALKTSDINSQVHSGAN